MHVAKKGKYLRWRSRAVWAPLCVRSRAVAAISLPAKPRIALADEFAHAPSWTAVDAHTPTWKRQQSRAGR
jgi:hypothetical protein